MTHDIKALIERLRERIPAEFGLIRGYSTSVTWDEIESLILALEDTDRRLQAALGAPEEDLDARVREMVKQFDRGAVIVRMNELAAELRAQFEVADKHRDRIWASLNSLARAFDTAHIGYGRTDR